jgi:thymidylate synthase
MIAEAPCACVCATDAVCEDSTSLTSSSIPSSVHPNPEEQQYLDLIRRILAEGQTRSDRTGTGTIGLFGTQMRFSLADNVFPLLTTKRTFYRGIVEELLWFIRGDTNGNRLSERDIHIWDGNGSREFLDSRGLKEREVGDLGPVYGFQWRHFGARYVDMHTDYTGKGYDQLQTIIDTLRTNPYDRRMIMSAWNPADLHLMALPPCHMFCQFFVSADRKLSCLMYQRSCDVGLGVPFNIASYSLLTIMIAHVTGLGLGEFVHSMGDTHVYLNHVDALKVQIERTPRPFPKLHIKPGTQRDSIDGFKPEDFELVGYEPYEKIFMKMAV